MKRFQKFSQREIEGFVLLRVIKLPGKKQLYLEKVLVEQVSQ
jgi:hypothetical protein